MINFNQLTENANSISYYTPYGFSYNHIIIDFIQNEYQSLEVYDLIENIIEYIDDNFFKHIDNITDIKGYIFEYITRRKPHLNIIPKMCEHTKRITFATYEIYSTQDKRTLMTINLTQILYIPGNQIVKI